MDKKEIANNKIRYTALVENIDAAIDRYVEQIDNLEKFILAGTLSEGELEKKNDELKGMYDLLNKAVDSKYTTQAEIHKCTLLESGLPGDAAMATLPMCGKIHNGCCDSEFGVYMCIAYGNLAQLEIAVAKAGFEIVHSCSNAVCHHVYFNEKQ